MIGEVDILGMLAPAILLPMLFAWILNLVVKRALEDLGFYCFVWHRHLFDLSLYIIWFGLLVLFTVPKK